MVSSFGSEDHRIHGWECLRVGRRGQSCTSQKSSHDVRRCSHGPLTYILVWNYERESLIRGLQYRWQLSEMYIVWTNSWMLYKNRKLKFDHKYIVSELPLFCHIVYFGDYKGEVQVRLNSLQIKKIKKIIKQHIIKVKSWGDSGP